MDFVWNYTFSLKDNRDVDFYLNKEHPTDSFYNSYFSSCSDNTILKHIVTVSLDDETFLVQQSLNNIVLLSSNLEDVGYMNIIHNYFGSRNHDITIFNGCESVRTGERCFDITGDVSFGVFGGKCYSMVFGNRCYSNTFGNGCSFNQYGNGCCDNMFGNECYSNTFGNYCYSNIFKNRCQDISIEGDNFSYISIESGVYLIDISCAVEAGGSAQNLMIYSGIHGSSEEHIGIEIPTRGGSLIEVKPSTATIIEI